MLPCSNSDWENESLFTPISNTRAMVKGRFEQKISPDTAGQSDHHSAVVAACFEAVVFYL